MDLALVTVTGLCVSDVTQRRSGPGTGHSHWSLIDVTQRRSGPGTGHSHCGVVAEWLARSTRVRKDTGSNPAEAGRYVTTVG